MTELLKRCKIHSTARYYATKNSSSYSMCLYDLVCCWLT